jgi:hypothetical protein
VVQKSGPITDRVPAHSEILGNGADVSKPQNIENRQSKGFDIPVLALQKGRMRPKQMPAFSALEPMQQKIEKASLPAHGTHLEEASFLPFENSLSPSVLRTLDVLIVHPGAYQDAIPKVAGRFIMDAFQPKSVVEYGCGHGAFSPPVRLASNTWGVLPCPFLFCNLRYLFAG